MKLNFKIASIYVLLPLLMSACSSSLDEEISDEHPTAFTLSVRVSSYASNQGRQTRSAATAYPVTFRNGDQLGIIALSNGSPVDKYNNVPFTYHEADGKWEPATALPFSTAYTYLVYYPYQAAMTGKTTKKDLITSLVPLADQRNEAAYRASDLLVCDPITPKATDKTLNVTFEHAFSLLVIPLVKATITSEGTTYQCGLQFASITAGTAVGLPYVASDGTVRLVVRPQTAAFKILFNCNGKLYSSSTSEVALTANYCYAFNELTTTFNHNFTDMQVGDFYCKNTSGNGYLIPNNAVSFPNDMNCIGLVFKKGKDASDDGTYMDVSGTSMSTIKGYVVALQDAGAFAWANKNGAYDFRIGTSTSDTDWNGYSNCQTMKEGTEHDWNITHFPAANACRTFGTAVPYLQYAAPTGSSGWFLPSCGQLYFLYCNGGLLSGQINKLKTTSNYEAISWFSTAYYWSSSEDGDYSSLRARVVGFGNGDVNRGDKNNGNRVRSIFAF